MLKGEMNRKETRAYARQFNRNNLQRFHSCKRSQLTIFIIIAIVIVAVVVGYVVIKDRISYGEIPSEFQPVENYFLDCVDGIVRDGAEVLGTQGGYIETPEFEVGSEYMPFSSQLDFFGFGVPYWYFKSGNNIIKEQVPSRKMMEDELGNYVYDRVGECKFRDFSSQGFDVSLDDVSSVDVGIRENEIDVRVNVELIISKEEEVVRIERHDVSVDSKLGKFYDLALKIYNYEKQEMFLEKYAVDVLRLYVPVDGFEITCSPLIWNFDDVVDELREALSANMQAIRLKGDYYKGSDGYFIENLETDEAVNFVYDPSWPTRVEVWPSENRILMAEPVGTQEGLGILGFCYVPYHFVYDVVYPVLIQVYDGVEMFQFPVAIIVNKNMPREALFGTEVVDTTTELCKYKNTEVVVYTYDTELNPVEADISFKCISDVCSIGRTGVSGSSAKLVEDFPQCVNGFIIAKSEGYATAKYQISTNEPGVADIIMDKLYDVDVELELDGQSTDEQAVIHFNSEDYSTSVAWPQQKKVTLVQGDYNISVYVYRNSSLNIEGYTTEKCSDVPRDGLLGVFGMTKEKCFDISIPSQKVEMSLSGGGRGREYIVESNLRDYGVMEIMTESLPKPASLDELQNNYQLFNTKFVYLNWR